MKLLAILLLLLGVAGIVYQAAFVTPDYSLATRRIVDDLLVRFAKEPTTPMETVLSYLHKADVSRALYQLRQLRPPIDKLYYQYQLDGALNDCNARLRGATGLHTTDSVVEAMKLCNKMFMALR